MLCGGDGIVCWKKHKPMCVVVCEEQALVERGLSASC